MISRKAFSLAARVIGNKKTRAMASSAAKPKIEWLVMIPDNPNALAKRVEIRP
jgi:hypothetical protein